MRYTVGGVLFHCLERQFGRVQTSSVTVVCACTLADRARFRKAFEKGQALERQKLQKCALQRSATTQAQGVRQLLQTLYCPRSRETVAASDQPLSLPPSAEGRRRGLGERGLGR